MKKYLLFCLLGILGGIFIIMFVGIPMLLFTNTFKWGYFLEAILLFSYMGFLAGTLIYFVDVIMDKLI